MTEYEKHQEEVKIGNAKACGGCILSILALGLVWYGIIEAMSKLLYGR